MSQQLSYIAAAVLHLRKDSSSSVYSLCSVRSRHYTAEIICCCVNVWSILTGSVDTVSVQAHSDEV